MDKSTLTVIVITAIIAAFVKEIVALLFSGLKKLFANKAITAKLRRAITQRRVGVVIDLALFAYCVWRIVASLRDPSPITRFAMFDMAYWFSLGTIIAARLDRMTDRYLEKQKQQIEELKMQLKLKEVSAQADRLLNALPEEPKKTLALPESDDEKLS